MTSKNRAFVVGWPIEHSRSPILHRYWLSDLGLDGDYEKQAIHPDNFDEFIKGFGAHGFVGGNVTLPFKERAFANVDEASERARRLGAVNTVWLSEDGRLLGDNTDVYGFLANLDALTPGWSDDPGAALVIGAGGAARAIIFALVERNFNPVWVLNRTVQRAEDLANFFGEPVRAAGLDHLSDVLAEASLVVNTTSAGLSGTAGLDIDWSRARPGTVATDIVYYPLRTDFLVGAEQAGLATVDGLGMLLHQAVPGFERWFGSRPMVDEGLRATVLGDIEGRS